MKALKRAKVLLASLSLCFVTLGCALLGVSPLTAVADGSTTVAAGDLVVAESNATVTAARETAFTLQDGTTASESYTGLYVNATTQGTGKDVTWKAAINGVFQDSMSMEYLLATPAPYSAGYFTISICDLDGNVICQNKHLRTNNDYPSAANNNKVQFIANGTTTTTGYILPSQGYYDADATSMGKITATLDENNALTVKEMKNQDGTVTEVTLGTVENATALADGFTVKFTSGAWLDTASQSTISLLIASINGVATTGATVEAQVKGDITYEGEALVNGKNVIALNEGEALKNFSVKNVPSIGSLSLAETSTEFAYSETFADKTAGSYEITVSNSGISKAYTVLVEELYATSNLFASDYNASIEPATTKTLTNLTNKDFTGVYITNAGKGNKNWTAKVNGVFSNTMSVTFLMPDNAGNGGAVGFTVCDLEGNAICEIRYKEIYNQFGTDWNGGVNFYDYATETLTGGTNGINPILPSPGYGKEGTLTVTLEGNTLKAVGQKSSATVDIGSVETTALANGFTLRITNANPDSTAAPSVLITSLNGVSTAGETVEVQKNTAISYDGEAVEKVITLQKGEEIDTFTATTVASIGSWSSDAVTETLTVESFADKKSGEYPLTVSKGLVSETFTVNVVAVTYTVKFMVDGNEHSTENYEIGDSVTMPAATKEGYTLIGWAQDGKLYAEGASVTLDVADAVFNAVFVKFTAVAGASIRVTEPRGLRWTATMDKTSIDSLANYESVSYACGTKITSEGSSKFVDIPVEQSKIFAVDGDYCFHSVLGYIKTENLDRVYYASHYMTVTYSDGSSKTFALPETEGRTYKGVVGTAYGDTKTEKDDEAGYVYAIQKEGATVYAKVNAATFALLTEIYNELYVEVGE